MLLIKKKTVINQNISETKMFSVVLRRAMAQASSRVFCSSIPSQFKAAFLEKSSGSQPTYTIKEISAKDLEGNPNKDKQV